MISGKTLAGVEFRPVVAGNLVQGNLMARMPRAKSHWGMATRLYRGIRPVNSTTPIRPTPRPVKSITLTNTIGGKAAAGNVIDFNGDGVSAASSSKPKSQTNVGAGVYIFNHSTGNVVVGNHIVKNQAYGIILYNSAGNSTTAGLKKNKVSGNPLANFREFTGPVSNTTSSTPHGVPAIRVIKAKGSVIRAESVKTSAGARHFKQASGGKSGHAIPAGPLHLTR